jgi:hypothetical protein
VTRDGVACEEVGCGVEDVDDVLFVEVVTGAAFPEDVTGVEEEGREEEEEGIVEVFETAETGTGVGGGVAIARRVRSRLFSDLISFCKSVRAMD